MTVIGCRIGKQKRPINMADEKLPVLTRIPASKTEPPKAEPPKAEPPKAEYSRRSTDEQPAIIIGHCEGELSLISCPDNIDVFVRDYPNPNNDENFREFLL